MKLWNKFCTIYHFKFQTEFVMRFYHKLFLKYIVFSKQWQKNEYHEYTVIIDFFTSNVENVKI